MSKPFAVAFAVVVIAISIGVWIGFSKTAGNHLVPTGSIGKVRTIQASEDLTYMVVDFKVKNDSGRDMIVRDVESVIDTAEGRKLTGSPVAAADVAVAFKSYPLLGEQYNPVLKERDRIPAHQAVDRMVGLRFDAPIDKVEHRKSVTLRVEDITGPVLELKK